MSETVEPTLPQPSEPAETAIPRLLDAHGDRLYALAKRFCGDAHTAEDVLQETFLNAWRSWDSFRGEASPTTWLYTIAVRACQRMHRKSAGEPEHLASLDASLPTSGPVADVGVSPLDAQVWREAQESVEAGLASLPDAFRLPLVLKDLVGLSVKDIGRVLGVAEATVKTRIHRARMALREAMEARLPQRDAPPPRYEEQVCFDLLRAKMEALDRGEPFSLPEVRACERCAAVFATLDVAKDVCEDIAADRVPDELRERLRHKPQAE